MYEQNAAKPREPVPLQSWEEAGRSLIDKVVGVDRRVEKKAAVSVRYASAKHQKRPRYKVLYFTITPLGDDSNGGSICCREHVRQLSQDDRIDLEVVAAADRRHQRGTLAFLAASGVKGEFVSYHDTPGHRHRRGMPWATRIWPYAHEQDGLWNAHVGETVVERVTLGSPDAIVVDYLHSAAFVKELYKGSIPVVTITLNREAEFHRDLVKHRYDIGGGAANHLGGMRLRKFESWIHKRSAAVVAIGRYDLPVGRSCQCAAYWFPPLPPEHPERWQYRGLKHIGFVGNIGHYPNKLAVKWLATKFAPALEQIDPEAVIRVVGADEASVPKQWKRPNVCYLGVADRATVDDIFQSAAFFIAPIKNSFGAKLKVYEAMGHGTPLLATATALSGVASLPWLTCIDLAKPKEAAELAAEGMAQPAMLAAMSQRIVSSNRIHAETQRQRWGDLIHHVYQSSRKRICR
jgi:glycosyltransferase involved in cell wall biosynthesis